MGIIKIILPILYVLITANLFAQDTTKQALATRSLFDTAHSNVAIKSKTPPVIVGKDSFNMKPKFDPHKATIRSAIIPGWGQAYNHEYWKIPIVYAVIGIPAITYIYNNTWYKRTRNAFNIIINGDTADYKNIYPALQPFAAVDDVTDLQFYRNEFRKDRDYSLFYFFIAWALNVVDATVFAHLKQFDVSDDLSMNVKLQPDFDPQTKTTSLGFALSIKKPQHKLIDISR